MPTAPLKVRMSQEKLVRTVPENFYRVWDIVVCLRKDRDAPVDIWGCDKVVDPKAPRDVFEFQILVAAMLSSQTRDRCVKDAMDNLLRADLSVGGILALTEEEIDEKIKTVGFHATKAKNIRDVAKIMRDQYGGHVPKSFPDLVRFPGIGPKIANMIMTCAFNEVTGIIVDTHVHRITNLLGWGCSACKPMCKQPEHTRAVLESWVPPAMWRDFTYLIVGLGQQSQTDRKLLLSRCMKHNDPLACIEFLRRIEMKMNKCDLKKTAIDAGVTDTRVLDNLCVHSNRFVQ